MSVFSSGLTVCDGRGSVYLVFLAPWANLVQSKVMMNV